MNRYRKLHRYAAITVLVYFITALTGVAAFAGHDCCGRCVERSSQPPIPAKTMMVSSDCCAVDTACTCAFQPGNDQDRQVYSISHVSAAGDELSAGPANALPEEDTGNDNRRAAIQTALSEIRIRSGPLYLTNQSFLC